MPKNSYIVQVYLDKMYYDASLQRSIRQNSLIIALSIFENSYKLSYASELSTEIKTHRLTNISISLFPSIVPWPIVQ